MYGIPRTMEVLCRCRGLVQAGLFSRASCRYRPRVKLRVGLFCSTSAREPGSTSEEEETSKQFRATMRLVPSSAVPSFYPSQEQSQVAVVTASDGTVKRGVTCSSFTSVSLHPPVVSFSMQQPSRMHELLVATRRFAVHVLSEKQVHYSVHFSRPVLSHQDQFDSIPHRLGLANVPLLTDCCAVLQCAAHTVHDVGDHHVWYGKVLHAAVQANETPLLYYARSYRSVGDAAFMRAFETATLGYEEWTHEAHLRMAWNYITAHGREEATPLIKTGISNYIDKNVGKVKNIYNETITLFFIHIVDKAIQKFESRPHLFEEFLVQNPHLMDAQLLSRHYSAGRIWSQQARESWLDPDLEPLP